jgi:hypothetical protein
MKNEKDKPINICIGSAEADAMMILPSFFKRDSIFYAAFMANTA